MLTVASWLIANGWTKVAERDLQESGVDLGQAANDQSSTNIITAHSRRIEEGDKMGSCGSSASILGRQKMMTKLDKAWALHMTCP
jgi:hypothetical protein